MTGTLSTSDVQELLEQFEYPFLLLNRDHAPILASIGAAKLLELRDRRNLHSYNGSLAPLIDLSKETLKRRAVLFRLRNAMGENIVGDTHELEIESASGRPIRVLTYCRQLRCADEWPEGPHALVLFQDLTYLQPFLSSIRQSRRNRSLLVMLSSYLGRSLSLAESGDFLELCQQAEKQLFSAAEAVPGAKSRRADLLRDVSTAVEIVDPLMISSSKIRMDIATSALLELPPVDFLRMMAHILLETADLGGPFATSRISAKLARSSVFRSSAMDSVELAVIGERMNEIPLHLSPLELYVYRTYVPSQYRVKNARRGKDTTSPSGTISEQLYSENLTIASELASRHRAELEATQSSSNHLVIKVRLPLAENVQHI